jgi:hypothetical protein
MHMQISPCRTTYIIFACMQTGRQDSIMIAADVWAYGCLQRAVRTNALPGHPIRSCPNKVNVSWTTVSCTSKLGVPAHMHIFTCFILLLLSSCQLLYYLSTQGTHICYSKKTSSHLMLQRKAA